LKFGTIVKIFLQSGLFNENITLDLLIEFTQRFFNSRDRIFDKQDEREEPIKTMATNVSVKKEKENVPLTDLHYTIVENKDVEKMITEKLAEVKQSVED
jgi:hypothetical protein